MLPACIHYHYKAAVLSIHGAVTGFSDAALMYCCACQFFHCGILRADNLAIQFNQGGNVIGICNVINNYLNK